MPPRSVLPSVPFAPAEPDRVRIWLDIENPPQVQYLTPLADAFREAGAEVVLTARDYGSTYQLLEGRGVDFHRVGASYGKEKWRKATGVVGRTLALARFFARRRPDAVVHAGRASALAGWLLRVPSFGLLDYEYVDVTVARVTHHWILHPRVMDASVLVQRGVPARLLRPFEGLKEDLTFAGVELADVEPADLPGLQHGLSRVLVRPPAEESHYYRSESGDLARELLRHLAAQEGAQVLLSPRYPRQRAYLDDADWRNEPVVVPESAPFLPLLKAVDAVVASGGTMAREAAWLGIPSYSIFQGAIGGVDRHLASIGRLDLVGSVGDFERIKIEPKRDPQPLAENQRLPGELVETVLSLTPKSPRAGGAKRA
jgi:predicted glycosyltransferase